MKRKQDCLLREVAGEYLLLPTGLSAVNLNGMIVLSETAAFVWGLLETEQSSESLLAAVLERYDAGEQEAADDLTQTMAELFRLGLLETSAIERRTV